MKIGKIITINDISVEIILSSSDIKIGDIAETGVEINAEVSPQLLVNLFVPNTPY